MKVVGRLRREQLKKEPVSVVWLHELVVNAVKTLHSVKSKSFIHHLALSSLGRIDDGLQWEILPVLSLFKLSTLTKLDSMCVQLIFRNTTCCPPTRTKSSLIRLQLKYKKDLSKMKGTSHFHSLTSEDNLALKNARKINKLVSEVSLSNRPGHLSLYLIYSFIQEVKK